MNPRTLIALTSLLLLAACGRSELLTDIPEEPPNVEQDLLARWNAAADAAGTALDYHWPRIDAFPHPTYREGNEEAYRQFGAVLARFYARADTVSFLERNQLLDRQWMTQALSNRTATFRALSGVLVKNQWAAPEDLAELQQVCARIGC